MFTFRRTYLGLFLIALVLLAAACQSGPDPSILAGDWEADTDFGSISLTVQPDGRTIDRTTIVFNSGGIANVHMSTNEQKFSNFTFEYETTQDQSTYTFHIKFNQDGETATVVWEGPSGEGGTVEMLKIQ